MANYDYAEEVKELRQKPTAGMKQVKIIGGKALQFGYPMARGIRAAVLEERVREDAKLYKLFTGTRIWIVPQDDCEEIKKEEKK